MKTPASMRRLTAASWPLMAVAWAGCPTIKAPASKGLVAGRPLAKAYATADAMRLEGEAGDHLLAHDQLVAVVSGAPARTGFRRPLGRLLDVHGRERQDDLLQSLVPALSIGGVPAVLVISSTSADDQGVRARGAVRGRQDLAIEIRYRLGRGDRHLEIDTRVTNTGSSTLALSGGDSVYLGNVAAFVPGVGDVSEGDPLATHWFGYAARGQAFAYSAEAVRAFDLAVHQTVIGDSSFTGSLRSTLRTGDVPPAGVLSWRSWVATGDSLADASERLFGAARTPLRTVHGSVTPMAPGAQVEVTSAGRPFTRLRPASDGHFEVALPPGRFDLVATRPDGGRGPATPVSPNRDGAHAVSAATPGRLVFDVRDDDGSPLGARLVLRDAQDARRTVYAPTGAGEVELTPGRWRVTAVRGFEHDIDEAAVTVPVDGPPARVDLTLPRVVDTVGWLAADLHLHAEGSGDSEVRFSERVRGLVAEGVELAVASDHNRVSDYGPALRALGFEDRLAVMSGSEISTTGRRRWGHFNAFPLEETPRHHDTTPTKLFADIRRGGERVIQVNHPRMPPRIGYFDLVNLATGAGKAAEREWDTGFDVIEVFNGIWLAHPDRVRRNLRDWFGILNSGVRVAASGNSDSHKLVLQEVGWPRTYIQTRQDDPGKLSSEAVVTALRAGRTLVTSGPFISMTVDGEGPGGSVRPAGRETVPMEVWVYAPPWVPVTSAKVIVDGRAVWEVPIPPAVGALRFHGRFDLSVERARWILVEVDGGPHTSEAAPVKDAWSMAITSPVFVDPAKASPVHSPPDSHALFAP